MSNELPALVTPTDADAGMAVHDLVGSVERLSESLLTEDDLPALRASLIGLIEVVDRLSNMESKNAA